MPLSHLEYMHLFNKTDPLKSPFKRHLEVCGIKTKNDNKTRSKKFLWGYITTDDVQWHNLDQLTIDQQQEIRSYLWKFNDYNDESSHKSVQWILNLLSYSVQNGHYKQ